MSTKKESYVYLYYIIYKLKNYYKHWIVKVLYYDELNNLKNELNKIKSSYEKYYIVERKIKKNNVENEYKRKQFREFEPLDEDIIISESRYIF